MQDIYGLQFIPRTCSDGDVEEDSQAFRLMTRCLMTFTDVSAGSWILKIETVRSSEGPVNIYQSTRRHIQEDLNLHWYFLINVTNLHFEEPLK